MRTPCENRYTRWVTDSYIKQSCFLLNPMHSTFCHLLNLLHPTQPLRNFDGALFHAHLDVIRNEAKEAAAEGALEDLTGKIRTE